MKRLKKVSAFISLACLLLAVAVFPYLHKVEANGNSMSFTERADVSYSIKNGNYSTYVKVVVIHRQNGLKIEQTVQECPGNEGASNCSVRIYPGYYFDNSKFTFDFFKGTAALTISQDICGGSCNPDMRLVPPTQLSWQADGGIQKAGSPTGARDFIGLWRTARVTGQVDGILVPDNVSGTLSIQYYNISYPILSVVSANFI